MPLVFSLRGILLFSITLTFLTTCSTFDCEIPDKFCNDIYLTLRLGPASVYSECGNTITKADVETKPSVQFMEAQQESKYLLIMVDPDAPTPDNPVFRYWLHWLVVNITGESLREGVQLRGQTLVDYKGPSPPMGSKPHRYQFLLVKQYESQRYDSSLVNSNKRGKFELEKYIISTHSCYRIVALYEYRSE